MISTFLNHELKSFWRSKGAGKSVAIRVVMGLLILYLFLNFLFLGIFLDKILDEVWFPKDDVIVSFCGILLMYYFFDILLRMQLQELPTLKVQPYLHLPVKRNTLVKYLAATSLMSVFNLWPFILFFPFIFKIVLPEKGVVAALAFIVSVLSLTVFNNYLALYIKRRSNLNGWIFLVVAGVLTLISLGDFVWHLYSIKAISYSFFGPMLAHPYLAVAPLVLAIIIYYINFYYLKANLYLEDLGSGKVAAYKNSTEYPFLNRFGSVGDLVANEIKLVLRNKRSRSSLIMGGLFMFYGLIFYKNPTMGPNDYAAIFVGVFMTGIFIINYGQFMHAWQASHFDGILVSKVKMEDFLKGKYLLFTMISTVAFLLTLPYAYFGWRVVVIHFVMYVYNLGVNTTIILFFANRNHKRIDLSKGASFNWEGVGATQLLVGFPLLLVPMIIYLPFKLLGYANVGLGMLAVTGIICIVLRPYFIKKLEQDFYSKKFAMAEGFRNK